MEEFTKIFYDRPLDQIGIWFSEHGIDIIFSIVFGFIIYYIGKVIINYLLKLLVSGVKRPGWTKEDKKKRQNTLASLAVTVWRVVVVVSVGIQIAREFVPDINFSTLVASLGIFSVVISLGAQSLVKDFLSGLFIISENQYRVGDIIEIGGYTGTVTYIGTRTTILRDAEGNAHYFPNGTITHVINKTMNYSIARIKINVASGTDIDQATKIINQIGEQLAQDKKWKSRIIEAPHFDSISSISAGSIEMIIVGKTNPSDQWVVSSKLRQMIIQEFGKNDISLA
ncbi:MAG: mechanosensitive ion channel [Candidatus Sacchiramonaceae bacterium]|nr:mechanosensitive ion channel [Candidatus Saccharimonadaceae bacterium]